MVSRYLTGSLKQCSPARAHAMAAAKRPPKAGFGTRSECKKWALAKTNASHNPSRDAQCAAVISSSWGQSSSLFCTAEEAALAVARLRQMQDLDQSRNS